MNRRKLTMTVIASIVGIGLVTLAESPTPKKQTKCPVMGGKINKAEYADVNGKRIYVCCAGCIAKIKADPEKYIKQLEAEGITLDKAAAKKNASATKSGCGSCGSH